MVVIHTHRWQSVTCVPMLIIDYVFRFLFKCVWVCLQTSVRFTSLLNRVVHFFSWIITINDMGTDFVITFNLRKLVFPHKMTVFEHFSNGKGQLAWNLSKTFFLNFTSESVDPVAMTRSSFLLERLYHIQEPVRRYKQPICIFSPKWSFCMEKMKQKKSDDTVRI